MTPTRHGKMNIMTTKQLVSQLRSALSGISEDLRELNSRYENKGASGTSRSACNAYREGLAHAFEVIDGALWEILDEHGPFYSIDALEELQEDVNQQLVHTLKHRVKR